MCLLSCASCICDYDELCVCVAKASMPSGSDTANESDDSALSRVSATSSGRPVVVTPANKRKKNLVQAGMLADRLCGEHDFYKACVYVIFFTTNTLGFLYIHTTLHQKT
jgi:hypothetical protein